MPTGFRTSMWSASFKLNGSLISDMVDEFFLVAPNFPAISVSLAAQAFSVPALEAMQKKGGNALGLKLENGPFFHILFYMAWNETSDDITMMKGAQDFVSAATSLAKERGLDSGYIYMPYASGYKMWCRDMDRRISRDWRTWLGSTILQVCSRSCSPVGSSWMAHHLARKYERF